MLPPGAEALHERLLDHFARRFDEPLDDAAFDELARAVFAFQFAHNAPYAAWCRARGTTPESLRDWRRIPAVPTGAFKHVTLAAGDAAHAEAVFRTSGTTAGAAQRGTHHVLDLALYHGSLRPTFAAYLLPDDARVTMLSLLPPAHQLPDSSLAHMVAVVVRELGDPHSAAFASVDGGLDVDALAQAVEQALAENRPVCLLGTSLSFVHWLDALAARGTTWTLPAGSRLMDTGGYKGQTRRIPAEQLRAEYARVLGLPAEACINEYGMTELCSQYYDTTLRDRTLGLAPRHGLKAGPPWLRARAVHAETLESLPPGEPGLLQHFDLANLGSVLAVQTEDIGTVDHHGIRLLGRVTDAQPRGCSIAMDELLRAARHRTP